jgi:hypothetical protein
VESSKESKVLHYTSTKIGEASAHKEKTNISTRPRVLNQMLKFKTLFSTKLGWLSKEMKWFFLIYMQSDEAYSLFASSFHVFQNKGRKHNINQ